MRWGLISSARLTWQADRMGQVLGLLSPRLDSPGRFDQVKMREGLFDAFNPSRLHHPVQPGGGLPVGQAQPLEERMNVLDAEGPG